MHNPRFEAILNSVTVSVMPDQLPCDAVMPPIRAFEANMTRIIMLGQLLPIVGFWSHMRAMIWAQASLNIVGDIAPSPSSLADDNTRALLEREEMKIFQAWHAEQPDGEWPWPAFANDVSMFVESRDGEILRPGVQALFASMLLGCWTAYEALLTDLWVLAVDKGPKAWVAAVLKSQALREDRANDQEKMLRYTDIADTAPDFDLSSCMGTLLVRTKKVDFQSYNNMKRAYEVVFGNDAKNLFAAESELDALEHIRNLFAHRGGVVDPRFKKQVERFARFANLQVGERLAIDGKFVADFMEMTFRAAAMCWSLVADRLAAHLQSDYVI